MSMKDRKERRKERIVTADRRLAEHSSGFDKLAFKLPAGIPMFRAEKDKTYRLSVIPFEVGKNNPYAAPGDLYYERTYYNHPRIGPNKDSVICSAKVFKKPCAVCDFRGTIAADPNPDPGTKEQIKALYPKERQLWLVYDHDDPKKGIQLFEVSNFCFGKSLDAKMTRARPEDRERVRSFADPVKGSYLMVGVTEKSTGAYPFLDYSDIEFKKREKPIPDALLDAAICLDDLIVEPKYKEIKKLLETGIPDEEEDEDESKEEETDGDDEEGETEDEDEEDSDGSEDGSEEGDGEGKGEDEDVGAEEEVFVKDDRVSWFRDGIRKYGKIVKVVGEQIHVNPDKSDKVIKKDAEDLTKVQEEEEEKPKPSKKPTKPKPKPESDDADDDDVF